MKVLFMGTPPFAASSLRALLDAGHQVPAAVTRPDARAGRGLRSEPPAVKRLAQERGIPVLQPASVRSPEFLAQVAALGADLFVVAAFGRILPQALLDLPARGALNVHASLLPRYRGAAPVAWAIARGETTTGVTIMEMVAALDAGPILSRRETAIGPGETAGQLEERLGLLGAGLLVETIGAIEAGQARASAQEEAQATWAPPLRKQDGAIRWSEPAAAIACQVRAFDPWPGARARFAPPAATGFTLWKAREAEGEIPPGAAPGQVLEASAARPGRVRIACGQGALLLEELQPDGRRRIDAASAVMGRYLKAGDRLGDG